MRPLKRTKREKSKQNLNQYKSTKKVSTILENKISLKELWQLLFFSISSILLIFIYLNQAWNPIDFNQIEIAGLSGITKNDVEKATRIFFPRNLMELNPKEMESHLIKNLPIKGISVSRKFFPPRVQLNFSEREPIAFASRVLLNKIENGMIDIEGNWIPLEFVTQSKKNKTTLFVENWSPNKKDDIRLIIKNRFLLHSPIERIKLNSLQEISIKTKFFNLVLLGSNTDRLSEQINKLNQLQKSLPNLLINTKVKIIDIKDPNKPELKTEKIRDGGV